MLKPKRRLKRREIKEDKFVTFIANASDFFSENSRNIIMGGGALILIVAVVFFMMKSKQNANLSISAKLLRAEELYHQNQYDASIPILQQLVDEYSGGILKALRPKNAGIATYYLAKANYAKENYTEAKRYFAMYNDDYADDVLFVSASHAGIAACYAIEGDKEKAAEAYQKAFDENPNSFSAPEFLFSAANNHTELQNITKAQTLLQKIIDSFGTSPIAQDARLLLAEISKKS